MSMRKRIMLPMSAVAVACATVIGLLGVFMVNLFVGDFNDVQLSKAYALASTVIEDYKINSERASATVAENDQLLAEMQEYLAGGEREPLVALAVSLMEATGVDSLTVMDTDGTILVRARDPDYFGDSLDFQSNVKNALRGERYTTIEAGSAVKLSVICGTPVYDRNKQQIGVVSVAYRLDESKFVDYIKHLTNTEVTVFLGDTRVSTTILNEKGERAVGTKAPHDVSRLVLGGSNYTGRVTALNKKLLSSYSPLRDAEGSVLGMLFVGLDTSVTDAHMVRYTLIMICIISFSGILSIFVSWNISSRISRPITELSDKAKRLAEGDVDIELSIAAKRETKDEVRILAREFWEMILTINKQAEILRAIASGNYSVSIPVRSEHDVINQAINRLIDRNNGMLAEINSSSGQVSAASKQIANGALSLSQGATEQAASIEELSASISEIAEQTKSNVEIAREAAELTDTIRSNAEKGSAQMDHMMLAVKEINEASNQISKVIRVIDDIAFQTNILALNATVEAARAGQHGKGFAVVAEEVRNLAAKSAEAAKDTGGLIENSIEKANLGFNIANETSVSLKKIVEGINRSADIVAQIAKSSDEQASAIAQINIGIDQVAQVVRKNSATAEESAAASEQMSGQSDLLTQLISQFKLKDTGHCPLPFSRY